MSIRSSITSSTEWRKLPITLSELCLDTVLRCGQSFRWKQSEKNQWTCTLRGRVLFLQQDSEYVRYRVIFPPSSEPTASEDDTESLLRDYFNLSVNLGSLYKIWSDADPNFLKKSASFGGIRILRQDPWENVVSFICSTNNNIQRISQMVSNLCLHFGPHLVTLDTIPYHDFPSPSALAGPGVEKKLRDLGFGYRAKYIASAATIIANEKPEGWLNSLRDVPYREAHDALIELPGVGPKVADCVCLMSMDKTEALPVDTHVWQIAQRDYKFKGMKGKTLNKATYDAIGDHFRALWGKEAGWAHSILFTADLKTFAEKKETVQIKTIKKRKIKVEEPTKEGDIRAGSEEDEVSTAVIKTEVKMENMEDETSSLADRIKRRRQRA